MDAVSTAGFARGVPAYHLLYVFENNGRRYTGMGYFTTLYTSGSPGWQPYSSYVRDCRALLLQDGGLQTTPMRCERWLKVQR
jgi:hypothetical protein